MVFTLFKIKKLRTLNYEHQQTSLVNPKISLKSDFYFPIKKRISSQKKNK